MLDKEHRMKNILKQIESKLRNQKFIGLNEAKREILDSASGFYWIYTKLPLNTFAAAVAPSNSAHVDFSRLAVIHKDLKHIINQNNGEYWCVYNGKGKQLKSRIVAEFTNTKGRTGKLALQRCFNEADFKVKYISCASSDKQHGIVEAYEKLERDLERIWRLHNGWPFLCRT